MKDMSVAEEATYEVVREITREATEQTLARLRAVIMSAGIQLTRAHKQLGGEADEDRNADDRQHGREFAESLIEALADELPVDIDEVVASVDKHDELLDREGVVDRVRDNVRQALASIKFEL